VLIDDFSFSFCLDVEYRGVRSTFLWIAVSAAVTP
jgi:hypothetical protein